MRFRRWELSRGGTEGTFREHAYTPEHAALFAANRLGEDLTVEVRPIEERQWKVFTSIGDGETEHGTDAPDQRTAAVIVAANTLELPGSHTVRVESCDGSEAPQMWGIEVETADGVVQVKITRTV
jgi:hypothetical protein